MELIKDNLQQTSTVVYAFRTTRIENLNLIKRSRKEKKRRGIHLTSPLAPSNVFPIAGNWVNPHVRFEILLPRLRSTAARLVSKARS